MDGTKQTAGKTANNMKTQTTTAKQPTHRLKLLTTKGIVTLLVSDKDNQDDVSNWILSEYGTFTQISVELI